MSVDTAQLQQPAEALVRESVHVHTAPGFPSNRTGLYWTFWLLVPLILPTCAFLYALPLAPVIWLGAKVAGNATANHSDTIIVIVLVTSTALACVTVGTLWQRTREVAKSM